MIDPSLEHNLYRTVRRSNTVIKCCLISILILNIIVSVIIILTIQYNQQQLIVKSGENHLRTQEYVKCIAEQLVIPISERGEVNTDICTHNADEKTNK